MLRQSVGLKQRTIQVPVQVTGIALHSGKKVTLNFLPAASNTGIVVERTDLQNKPRIQLKAKNVFETKLATKVGSEDCFVSTVEHFLAAAFALGIDNLVVQADNSEFPILDGSSVPFLVALSSAKVVNLEQDKNVFVVKKEIEVVCEKDPTRFIRILPSSSPKINYSIDFSKATKHIGAQQMSMALTGEAFVKSLSFARTFCLQEEVQYMQSRGLALGGNLSNALVVDSVNGVVNSFGLRAEREFVRHKMLDCIGDLALVGMPILGEVIAHKAGHDLHTAMAKKIEAMAGAVVSVPETSRAFGIKSLFGVTNFSALFPFPMQFTESSLDSAVLVKG